MTFILLNSANVDLLLSTISVICAKNGKIKTKLIIYKIGVMYDLLKRRKIPASIIKSLESNY